MRQQKYTIIILVWILFCLYSCNKLTNNTPSIENNYVVEIDSLHLVNDSLTAEIDSLREYIICMDSVIQQKDSLLVVYSTRSQDKIAVKNNSSNSVSIPTSEAQQVNSTIGTDSNKERNTNQSQVNTPTIAYVLIGTKTDLRKKKVIKQKHLVDIAELDIKNFIPINVAEWKEVSFSAKQVTILTDMPTAAYKLQTTDNKTYTLTITKPTLFWSQSKYLVIQTD